MALRSPGRHTPGAEHVPVTNPPPGLGCLPSQAPVRLPGLLAGHPVHVQQRLHVDVTQPQDPSHPDPGDSVSDQARSGLRSFASVAACSAVKPLASHSRSRTRAVRRRRSAGLTADSVRVLFRGRRGPSDPTVADFARVLLPQGTCLPGVPCVCWPCPPRCWLRSSRVRRLTRNPTAEVQRALAPPGGKRTIPPRPRTDSEAAAPRGRRGPRHRLRPVNQAPGCASAGRSGSSVLSSPGLERPTPRRARARARAGEGRQSTPAVRGGLPRATRGAHPRGRTGIPLARDRFAAPVPPMSTPPPEPGKIMRHRASTPSSSWSCRRPPHTAPSETRFPVRCAVSRTLPIWGVYRGHARTVGSSSRSARTGRARPNFYPPERVCPYCGRVRSPPVGVSGGMGFRESGRRKGGDVCVTGSG